MLLQELNVKVGLLLDEFNKNSKKVKDEAEGIKKVFTDMKTALISVGVFAFLKDAVNEFMEAERVAIMLSNRIKQLGGDFDKVSDQVMSFADTMSAASGINDEELKTSLTGLIDVTKDTEISMSLLQDAMDLHIATGLDMKRATELVGRSFAGERGELTELGKMFGISQEEATSFGNVMKVVRSQIEGAATNTKDLTQKMGTIASAFGDLKGEVGRLASGDGFWAGILTSLINVTTKGLKVINSFQAALRASWKNITNIFKKGFKSTQEDAKAIMDEFVKDTVKIFSDGEKKKTKVARIQAGKRQKWADDLDKSERDKRNKEIMDVIKAEDKKMAIKIAKGQATQEQLATLMSEHSEKIKTAYGEMSTQYQDYEAQRVQATVAANEHIMASGQALVTGLSTGFEAMFNAIKDGTAETEDIVAAFARAMGKSVLNAIATSLEGKAAEGMAGYLTNMLMAGPWGAAPVSAYSLPLIAALAGTAGMVRGLAGMLAEGGTVTKAGVYMMAEKPSGEPETAIPLSRMDEVFQKYSYYLGKKSGGATAGNKTVVNVHRINDNRGAIVASSSYDKGRAAKNLGQILVERGIIKK